MKATTKIDANVAFRTPDGSGQHVPMIGRLHHTVIDCPDPQQSAMFWSVVLGMPVTYDDGDFVVVSPNQASSGLAFQRSAEQRPPTWPNPTIPSRSTST